MDYLSIHFLLYVGRWITSAIVMAAPLYLLVTYKCCAASKYAEYIHLFIIQLVGALIFYKVDAILFRIQ